MVFFLEELVDIDKNNVAPSELGFLCEFASGSLWSSANHFSFLILSCYMSHERLTLNFLLLHIVSLYTACCLRASHIKAKWRQDSLPDSFDPFVLVYISTETACLIPVLDECTFYVHMSPSKEVVLNLWVTTSVRIKWPFCKSHIIYQISCIMSHSSSKLTVMM